MKRAVILHGTDNSPAGNWFPWLKEALGNRGYEVWVPELPNNHNPNREGYNNFLLSSDWDFRNNLIIGHSSGAVAILNLLEDKRCPKIATGVLVGAWAHTRDTDLDKDQFAGLFPAGGFNFEEIKQKAGQLLFVHGDDDPYCPLDKAQWLAQQTGSEVVIVPKGQHFSTYIDPSFTKFPRLLELLEARQLA